MTEIELLRREIARMAQAVAPWIGQEEMQARYNVTGKTLLAMERRREIPTRVNGRWSRVEVMEWESRISA